MNRRGFLEFVGAGVAGIALDQAIPLNRVWSFPKKIVLAREGVLDRPYGFEWSADMLERIASGNDLWFFDHAGKLWKWNYRELEPVEMSRPIERPYSATSSSSAAGTNLPKPSARAASSAFSS